MAREYNLDKNTSRFVLAYGKHILRGQMTNFETLAVGSELQVTFRRALGIGGWEAQDALWYVENESAHQLASGDFHFHDGQGTDVTDAFFPTSATYDGYAYDSIRLPIGLSADAKPENAISINRCLLVEDYNSSGTPQGLSYSPSPARVAADLVLRLWGDVSIIDFGAWVTWRDWCDALISATIDSVGVTVPRFEANIFITPPFNLGSALDILCRNCCSDWQWRAGKIRFMGAEDRTSEFTFDLTNVSKNDFKYIPIDPNQRPNMVRIFWRDALHPYLKEAEPIEVRRATLITEDGEIENPLEINIGVANKSQAERTTEYWAKVRIDNARYARLKSDWTSYPVLPADLTKVTHDVPNWTDKLFKVIEKDEDEDEGDGYDLKLQLFPATNPYSDSGTTDAITPVLPTEPNPFDPPDEPTLTVAEETETSFDGVVTKSISGIVDFSAYGFDQRAKILIERPSHVAGTYEEILEVRPDENNSAEFRIPNMEVGTHNFKAIAYNERLQIVQTDTPTVKPIVIATANLTVNTKNATSAVARSLISIDEAGQALQRDGAVVDEDDITVSIVSQAAVESGKKVDVRLNVSIDDGASHNHSDSISAVECDVFDQFGTLIQDNLPQPMTLKTAAIHLQHTRTYADAIAGQAYYRIRVLNYFGWSAYVYLQGTTLTTTIPTAKIFANCPTGFTAVPVSDTEIQIGYTLSGNVDLYKRAPAELEADWVKHNGSAITSSPDTQPDFIEYMEYELQLRSVTTGTNRSSILKVITRPQPAPAPTYLVPTAPGGVVNAAAPTTALDFWCTAADSEDVEVWVDSGSGFSLSNTETGVTVGDTITKLITGLSPSTNRKVKFRHKYSGPNYSDYTAVVDLTTDPSSPPDGPPHSLTGLAISQGDATADVTINWLNDGGDGTFKIETKKYSTGTPVTLETADPGLTTYEHVGVDQDPDSFIQYYKVTDNDISGDTGWQGVAIPAYNPFCFLEATQIMSASRFRVLLFNLNMSLFGKIKFFEKLLNKSIEEIKVDELVFAHDERGRLYKARVERNYERTIEEILKIRFEGKLEPTWVAPEHPYRVEDKSFQAIGNLEIGRKIFSREKGLRVLRKIESVERHLGRFKVYNLTCVLYATYFANQDEVHNKEE